MRSRVACRETTSRLGAGRKYSILVVDRDADSSSTITNNSLYGESELFQVVSEGSGTAGFGTSIQFLLGALLGSAAGTHTSPSRD